jgi:hypothetical protein
MRGQLWLAASAPSVHSVPPSVAYLWIPIAVGGGLAFLLVLLTGLIGMPYVDQGAAQTVGLLDSRFWTTRFYASAAWTFSDSGVTNITALATAVVAILASSAVAAIFTTDPNPFIIMNVACGGIVAAAPILFGVCNVIIMRRNPVVAADARLMLQEDATITLPFGASIAVAGGATVTNPDDGSEKARIRAGGSIPVPPGSVITVKANAIMALPSGSILAISRGAALTVDSDCQIASGDLAPPQAAKSGRQHIYSRHSRAATPDPEIAVGDLITLTEGATTTVTGVADILLPKAVILAPGRSGMGLKPDTTLTVPSGTNVMAAGMGSVLPTAALTTFGAGAEIGLVAVLAAHYSTAGGAGDVAAIVISAVVAAVLVLYGATSIRSLADPTSGTSLSSAAGTSFTL